MEHQASPVRFVFFSGHGVPASALQLRRFTPTGELVEKMVKWHFPALGGTTVRSVPAVLRASGGKLKLRMRSQTRVLQDEHATESGSVDPQFMKPKAWTLRVSLKSSLDQANHKMLFLFSLFCWGPLVPVVVSLVVVLSSLYIAFDGNNMHFLNDIDLADAKGLDASGDLFVLFVSATF